MGMMTPYTKEEDYYEVFSLFLVVLTLEQGDRRINENESRNKQYEIAL